MVSSVFWTNGQARTGAWDKPCWPCFRRWAAAGRIRPASPSSERRSTRGSCKSRWPSTGRRWIPWRRCARRLEERATVLAAQARGAYLRLEVQSALAVPQLEDYLLLRVPGAEVVSLGRSLEVLKQVGSPLQLDQTYDIASRRGSHGIGHTRLSTESRVDLSHSQPFWAHGVPDLVTVHNGHITNYHKLRRRYEQRGYRFFTENDSEVIGVYLRDRLAAGLTLPDALRSSLDDFDGSFCYLAASEDYLAFVKDRFGFKPLMLAETDAFVALATEEIALRQALGRVFLAIEPAPGTMGVWSVKECQPVTVS